MSFRRILSLIILWILPPSAQAEGSPSASQEPLRNHSLELTLCPPLQDGCYLDADGVWRDPTVQYEAIIAAQEPNYWRGIGWTTMMLAGGIAWYWIERDQNAVDWDLDSWKARFEKRAYRFDSNEFPINWVWHPLSGAGFYAAARANNWSVLASTANVTLASFLWEYLLEFKERVSVNDTLVTPLAGLALGEYFVRLGRFLATAPGGGTRWQKALRGSLGLPIAMHEAWDGVSPPPEDAPTDQYGWGTEIAGDFLIALGALRIHTSESKDTQYEVLAKSRLIAIPGYLREGRTRFVFTDANLTSLAFRGGGGAGRNVELDAEAVLAGIHLQRVARVAQGFDGDALTVGASVHYRYRRLGYAGFTDDVSTVGLPGLALDGHLLRGPAVLSAGVRLHGEFGSTTTPAFDLWKEENPDTRTKSVLEEQGYYYGWGGAGLFHLEACLPWLRLGSSLLLGAYHSRDRNDRKQERIEDDFNLIDRQLRSESWLGFVVPQIDLYIGTSAELFLRGSQAGGFETNRQLVRYGMHVGLVR